MSFMDIFAHANIIRRKRRGIIPVKRLNLGQNKGLFTSFKWSPKFLWLCVICLLLLADTLFMKRQAAFLYFQF